MALAEATPELEIVQYARARDLPESFWASPTVLGTFFSRFWLEETERFSAAYVVVWSGDRPVAATVCYLAGAPEDLPLKGGYEFFVASFGNLGPDEPQAPAGLGASDFYPMLVCGPLLGFENALVVDPQALGEEAERARLMLIQRAREVAVAAGARTLHFPFLSAAETLELAETAGDEPLMIYHSADHHLPVPPSFDDYLSLFSSKRRNGIRKEMEAFKQAGYELQIHPAEDVREIVETLYYQNAEKYGGERWREFADEKLKMVRAAPPGSAQVCVARRQGMPAGMCQWFRPGSRRWEIFIVGLDYARVERSHFVYQMVMYYAPIQEAIKAGLKTVRVSEGGDQVKLLRACRAVPRCLVLWPLVDGPWERIRPFLEERSQLRLQMTAAQIIRYGRYDDQVDEDLGEALELFA